jgi:hypothetical protein
MKEVQLYNFQAFLHRYSIAIKLNLHSEKRMHIIRRACKLLSRFDEYSQHLAIKRWHTEFTVSPVVMRAYIDGKDSEILSKSEIQREFLSTFNICENEISGQLDIERDGTKYTVEELAIIAEDEGVPTYNFKYFLNTSNRNITVVELYNPLNTMFKRLADDYRGEPVIDQLASCIRAYDFGDRINGFYQDRLGKYLHKWICKAAGQAMHISANDVMLLWIEPMGGSGKSYINQWLFSLPDMQDYYIRISENESFMDMKGISRAKFAIDWDELPLSRKRYLSFKSHIAAQSGQRYDKKTKRYEDYTRQVNFIGSTNKANREKQKGYLLDDDAAMKRRIAPIEIEGRIDYKKYTKDIDLAQLWGQAAADILKAKENNNERLLSWECDYEDLRTQNHRYVCFNSIEEKQAIKQILIPAEADHGDLVSASDIIQILNASGLKIFMSPWEMGQFLSKTGFKAGRNKLIRGWWIKR